MFTLSLVSRAPAPARPPPLRLLTVAASSPLTTLIHPQTRRCGQLLPGPTSDPLLAGGHNSARQVLKDVILWCQMFTLNPKTEISFSLTAAGWRWPGLVFPYRTGGFTVGVGGSSAPWAPQGNTHRVTALNQRGK